MALTPAWFAFLTVKEGVSANAALRMATEAGMGVRRSTFLKMVGEVKAHYSRSIVEPSRPMNRRPTPQEVTDLTTKSQRGYIQYIDLFVRNKTTGLVTVRPQAIRTGSLMSRDRAVQYVTDRYRQAIDRSATAPAVWGTDPDEVVVGGIYTATQRFVPES